MFTRQLTLYDGSFFIFGPRGTGKSTWIARNYPQATTFDLLEHSLALEFSRNPTALYSQCKHLPESSCVVIDEVQKVPELLDEVHRLIEQQKLHFILSGSSARKLKRVGVNLLAGRAITREMFALVSKEVNFKFDFKDRLVHGMLPLAFTSEDPKPYLRTYTETYLAEEIKAEALTRNIGNFARFLEIASRHNAQIINTSNISRDAQVARQTVASYYDILIDTLVGFRLPAWKKKSSTRQRSLPKFYFFDSGVARALSGRLPYPPTNEELGPLFETFILQELRAYLSYTGKNYPLHYWGKQSGGEVDIVVEDQNGFIGIELKISERWDKRFNKGLAALSKELPTNSLRRIGVYGGERRQEIDNVNIYPALEFLKALWADTIIQ